MKQLGLFFKQDGVVIPPRRITGPCGCCEPGHWPACEYHTKCVDPALDIITMPKFAAAWWRRKQSPRRE